MPFHFHNGIKPFPVVAVPATDQGNSITNLPRTVRKQGFTFFLECQIGIPEIARFVVDHVEVGVHPYSEVEYTRNFVYVLLLFFVFATPYGHSDD